MTPFWKWVVGIVIALIVLSYLAMPLSMFFFHPVIATGNSSGYGNMPMMRGWQGGSGMMGGYGMMGGGYGFMGPGTLFSGLIQLGELVLIVLGIIWLVRALRRQGPKGA